MRYINLRLTNGNVRLFVCLFVCLSPEMLAAAVARDQPHHCCTAPTTAVPYIFSPPPRE